MSNLDNVHPSCQAFVKVVEELLKARRTELKQGQRSFANWNGASKTFRYNQFLELVYPSYKALRSGKLKRPPDLAIVRYIADYLECDGEERARLITAAGHHSVLVSPSPEESALFLADARKTLAFLSLPAYILNRYWDVLDANEHLLKLLGMTRAQFGALPDEMRNVIQLIFDRQSPLYHALYCDHDEWEMTAKRHIVGFKLQTRYCESYPEFEKRLKRFRELPNFSEYWDKIDIYTNLEYTYSDQIPHYVTTMYAANGRKVRIQTLFIFSNYNFLNYNQALQVVAWQPFDAESCALFREFGIPIPEVYHIEDNRMMGDQVLDTVGSSIGSD